ncbi:MAG: glycosyltransferase [Thermoprotei archaeon]|jgi:cellulose synthase/poly-beta-1,6-N-acetylglucosamine synthase-like glycosyltransferase
MPPLVNEYIAYEGISFLTWLWIITFTLFTLLSVRVFINIIASLRSSRQNKSAYDDNDGYLPYVSIILPIYNESRVINRLLNACTSIDYTNYEIIIADDSTDEEAIMKIRQWKKHPRIKIVHRNSRKGFKAGAVNNALKYIHPLSQYVLIFDADYVPPPDIIKKMLKHFNDERVAAVQGYTKHILNEDKNFITRSVRMMFTYYSMIEMPGRRKIGGFVPLMGSVLMIRREVLESVMGFNEKSLTEDWDLASVIRMAGYKIVFDENIQVPAECPNSFRSLIRQQIRWAEGITRDTKKRLISILKNKNINMISKIDFIISGFYGLQSILGIFSYLIGFIKPFMNINILLNLGPLGYYFLYIAPNIYPLSLITGTIIGLYKEHELSKIPWILDLIIVMSALTPFMAYGTLRGLLLDNGLWLRTPKTGEITKGDLAGEEEPKEREPEPPIYIRPILQWVLSY